MTYRMESGNLLYAKPLKCTSKMAQFAIPLFRVVKRVLTIQIQKFSISNF